MYCRNILTLAFALGLVACGDPAPIDVEQSAKDVGLTEEEYTVHDNGAIEVHAYDKGQEVSKTTFDGDWPLAVDHGYINCQEKATSFTADDGTVYALSGFGRAYSDNKGLGWQPITPESEIWLDNPEIPGTKVSISNLASAAMELCEG